MRRLQSGQRIAYAGVFTLAVLALIALNTTAKRRAKEEEAEDGADENPLLPDRLHARSNRDDHQRTIVEDQPRVGT